MLLARDLAMYASVRPQLAVELFALLLRKPVCRSNHCCQGRTRYSSWVVPLAPTDQIHVRYWLEFMGLVFAVGIGRSSNILYIMRD